MRRVVGIAPVSIIIVLATLSIAYATQIVLMTPKEMGAQAELVVHGKVTEVRSFWNEKHTKIFTRTVVSIEDTYKGTRVPAVEILQLGGTVGNVRVTVDGAILWKPGEEVLLFLEPYTEGAYQVTGLSQGKFIVERDPDTGTPYITRPPLEGVKTVRMTSDDKIKTPAKVEKVTLERFVSEALAAE